MYQIRESGQGANLCDDCLGLCCVGAIGVYLSDFIYDNELFTKPSDGKKYPREMKTDKNNKCIAYKDHKCSIYDVRPWECRAFKMMGTCCIKFRQGKLTEHSCYEECVLLKEK